MAEIIGLMLFIFSHCFQIINIVHYGNTKVMHFILIFAVVFCDHSFEFEAM